MSYGAFGSTVNTFSDGAVGGNLTRKFSVLESVGNIMAFPFQANTTDLSGNHTIDDGTPTLTNTTAGQYTYDGQNMLRINFAVGEAPRIIASTQAHQIPLTEPVTSGFFCMADSWGGGTPQLMVSGPGSNAGNYGLQRQSSVGWRYQGDGATPTSLGDHRDITGTNRWFHMVLAISGSRSTSSPGAFYINGTEVWSGNIVRGNNVSSTDNFSFGSDSDESTAGWQGFMSNVFVTDTLLDSATIKALSDEAFGHASPYAPPV